MSEPAPMPDVLSNPATMMSAIKPADLSEALKDAGTLIEQAGRVPTDTATWTRQTFSAAGDLRKMIKARIKAAEDLRKAWTGPINTGVKLINAFFKERVEPLEKADSKIDAIMLKWAREEEERARAEQEKQRKAAEEQALREAQAREEEARRAREAEAAAAQAGDLNAAQQAAEVAREAEQARDTVIDQAAAMPVADTTVRKARGVYGSTSGVRKTWQSKIVDLRALPDDAIALIMDNEDALTAIRRAIRSLTQPRLQSLSDTGKCDPLPGVEFEQVSNIAVR